MHVRTASITDGIDPPREFRTVAALLTLTGLITRGSRDDIRDLIGPLLDLDAVFAFQHDASRGSVPE
jgi:hypothetical protein